MDIQSVDPRDIEVETPVPTYRVDFRDADRSHSREYEITGATSVHEVIDWARAEADGRDFELLVVDGSAAYVLVSLPA